VVVLFHRNAASMPASFNSVDDISKNNLVEGGVMVQAAYNKGREVRFSERSLQIADDDGKAN